MSFAVLTFILLSLLHRVASSTSGTVTKPPVMSGWFAGFHATEGFPLSNISWPGYNMLFYSFAITTPDVNSLSLNGSNPSILPDFVNQAHAHDVGAHVSLGGWTGSRWFSSNLATAENRSAFVQTVAHFAEQYNLDGINFDWEYPGKQGIGCNIVNANDTENLLAFLQELRANPVGAKLTLSAATSITPFLNASGHPSQNVSGFAEVLDFITIMNYDIWGKWSSSVGPNSPLNDTCAPSAYQQGSAVSAVAAWNAAGMPSDQIVLGLALYGHSFNVSPSDAFINGSTTELAAYPKFNASNQPHGDMWDDTGSVDVCGVYEEPGGTFRIWGLVEAEFLTADGNPAADILYRYDNCSQTPYVYNKTSQVMISFENAQSFAAKGKYINETNLRGFAVWEVGGDYHHILLDAIFVALSFSIYSHAGRDLVGSAVLMNEINGSRVTTTTNETAEVVWPWPHFPTNDPSVGVDQPTYDDLVRYTKYASGAYQVLCPRPMGNTLVLQFQDLISSTKGFIARDDKRGELVVAFRGTTDVNSILLDASIILVPLHGPGIPPDSSIVSGSEPHVHVGFHVAYNSIAQTVLAALETELGAHPSYDIISCGHSLGGAIASIASVAFSHVFPGKCVALYTFGQPRTGDQPFAHLVEQSVGIDNIYRCVHSIDGVPTMIPTRLGYRHFGAEYWQFNEFGSPKNVKRFEGGEDPNGSANIPSTGVNPAHWVYFHQRGFFH